MLEYYKISSIAIVICERFRLCSSSYLSFVEFNLSGIIINFSVFIISSNLSIYTRW